MSRMFDIVTKTWNPIVGCLYSCVYCWARQLAIKRKLYPRGFKPQFFPERLRKVPKKGFVFVGDMADMFGGFIPSEWIEQVLKAIRKSGSKATFLFLTRNPIRYLEFQDLITDNMMLGVTLETHVSYELLYNPKVLEYFNVPKAKILSRLDRMPKTISNSPNPRRRILDYIMVLRKIDWVKGFISIEPILLFNIHDMYNTIRSINPDIIYIGYDNYGWRLPEPPLNKTLALIYKLERFGYTIYRKTIRKAWWEVDE